MSPYFLDAMFALRDLPIVTDIRGVGMMAAIDVAVDGAPGARGHEAQKRLYDAGLNLKSTGDALIVAPPFVAERHHIDEIAGKLRAVLAAL
jgi:beta-alanine--pyruvate transaminase